MNKRSRIYLCANGATTFGAAIICALSSLLIPQVVLAQSPDQADDSEQPLKIEKQGPICGKLELPPAQKAIEKAVEHAVATKRMTEETAPKKVAHTPGGGFNHVEHVQEFNWLSDEPAGSAAEAPAPGTSKSKKARPQAIQNAVTDSDTEPASDDNTVKPQAKPVNAKITKTAAGGKSNGGAHIDASKVKVGSKPHCSGVADFYADHFHGLKTASGQIHDKEKFTAAHRTLPFGTKLKVVNRNTGKACVVTVNDRGPFTKARIIDLSVAAANELGLVTAKSRLVDCYIVENE